jgi:curli biogenesis system outer membrane secretion channel CsgG
MKTIVFLMLGAVVSATGWTAEDTKPTVFVAPLDGDLSQIQGWQPALGEGLAEMLITELTKLGKFTVLESTALPELIEEIRLGEAGFVSDSEKVDKGGFAGADFMLRGKVTRFGSAKQGVDLGGFVPGSGGKLGIGASKSDVRIDWRLVDTATRKIVTSGNAVAQQTGLGFDIGVGVKGHGGKIGFENKEFMNSALGKATVKALNDIIQQIDKAKLPESGRLKAKASQTAQAEQAAQTQAAALRKTPGKVIAVANAETLIVSLGSEHGFKTGDKLRLYETVDTKDDAGNVVFTEEKLVGEITLEAVQADRSKAKYDGKLAVQKGWVVKAE